jgi:hypothetical protein
LAGIRSRSSGIEWETIGADIMDCRDSKVPFEWSIMMVLKVYVCGAMNGSCKSANSLGVDSLALVLVRIIRRRRFTAWDG